MNRGMISAAILMAAGYVNSAQGQVSPATLVVELANVVEYQMDVSDLSKWGTNPNVTQGLIAMGMGVGCVGVPVVAYGDIVSVNGEPAKGAYVGRAVSVCLSPSPTPGVFAISDISANSLRDETYYILQNDGITPVGTIMVNGLNGSVSPTPPGPPAGPQNYTIVGGTGAFLGARGQKGNGNPRLSSTTPVRTASIVEDPSRRRQNGGGHIGVVLYVIPMLTPNIVVTANGPAVTHSSDFSLVSASKPVAAGEILSMFATGLGPTRASLNPGQPFPSSPLAVVNSPINVTVNGESAEVLGAVGYPGSVDGYQVNFRMPADAAKGAASIQLTAAWIIGTSVSIAIQ